MPGVITAHSGPLSCEVRVAPQTVLRQHINQFREFAITVNPNMDDSASQPNPAVLMATPQSNCVVSEVPTCSGSEEAVHDPRQRYEPLKQPV